MTAWLHAVPTLTLAVALIVVPGLLIGLAARLRGLALLGAAPLLSVGVVAGASLTGRAGIAWGPLPLAATTALGVLVAVVLGWRWRPPAGDPAGTQLAGLAGAAFAGLLALVVGARGMNRPGNISQTFDAVFHLNLIQRMAQTGDASSLDAGTLNAPGSAHAFYPAAFHALAALPVSWAHVPVPEAANLTALAVAIVAWPLSMTLLLRSLIGRRAALLGAATAMATSFAAAPYLFLSYGVLWPNLLGMAVLPAGVAAVLELLGQVEHPTLGRAPAVGLLVVAFPALMLSHPNAVFSLLLYGAVIVLAVALPWGRGLWLAGRTALVSLVAAGAVVVVAVAWEVLNRIPILAAVRSMDWPANGTLAQAFGEGLFNAPVGQPIGWSVTLLVAVGMFVAARRPRWRWVLAAHLLVIGLYGYAAAVDSPLSQDLTGFWYNDKFRLAAMLPITAVPLAGLGAAWLGAWAWAWVGRRRALRLVRVGWQTRAALAPVAVVAVAAVASHGFNLPEHSDQIWIGYHPQTDTGNAMLGPGEQAFLADLGRYVPAGEMILNDPWNGSGFAWALSGREVVFPHLAGQWDPARMTVLRHFDQLTTDPEVCSALNRLRARYLVFGNGTFWPGDHRAAAYQQIDPGHALAGLRPVVARDGNVLYEITACGA